MSKDKKPKKRTRKAISYRHKISTTPPSGIDHRGGEDILAKLVAKAIAAKHPELFKKECDEGQRELHGDE